MSKNFSYEDALTPPNAGNAFSYEDATGEKPKEPGFAARLGQGASRALDSAKTALTDDPNKIAKIAADQARTALPQTETQRKMAEEMAPYVDAANKAEGVVDNVKTWGAAGFKRAGQLLSNPGETGKMIAEQLPNSLPSLAGGIAGAKLGAMAGTAVAPGVGTVIGGLAGSVLGGFAGGYGLEKGAAMQDQVQKEAQAQRIDLQDESAVARMVALKQPEFDAAAQRKGVGTAGTDALLNVATMGLAGVGGRTLTKEARTLAQAVKAGTISAADAAADVARLQAANTARNTLGAKALRGAGVVGAEMGGEGFSEGVGQKLAYGNVDAGEVIDESLMGLGTGGAMALGSKAFNKAAGIVDQDATTQNIAAASDGLGALGTVPTTPQAGPTLALPAPERGVIQVAGDGTARTPAYQAPGYVGDVTDVEPRAVNPVREQVAAAAEQGGALSSAALTAIDTGLSDAMQPAPEQAPPQISLEEADARDQAAYEQFFASHDSDPVVSRYFENDDDIPGFDAASNASEEDFLRALGATDEDIQDAIATSSQSAIPQSSAASNAGPQAYEPAGPREGAGEGAASQTGQVNAGAIQQAAPDAPVPGVGGPVGADGAGSAATAVFGASGAGGAGTGAATGSGAGATEVGSARAGGRGDSNQALSAPTNLRDALVRVRQQKQEAANAQAAQAPVPAAAPVPGPAAAPAVEATGVKPAGQRQLSADEQAAQDREEARAKELSLPPVLSARLQEAHKAHGRGVKRSVVERSIANEKANNTGTPKAKRERADRIARLEADLALFDEAAAMPPKEAAGPASIPATIGANSEPTPPQAIQAGTQPAQAAAAPAAGPAPTNTAAPAPAGAPEVRALSNGTPTANTGAQAAPAGGTQGNAQTPDQIRRARLEREISTGKTNNGGVIASLRPSAIEKRKQELDAMGERGRILDAQGKAPRATAEQLTGAQERWQRMTTAERQAVAARTDVKPILRKNLHGAKWENLNVDVQRKLQAAMEPQAVPALATGPVRVGRDNTSLGEGGKPFKTRKAAGDAKKLQPTMRVVTVPGGYALAEKTPAQLAAEERASRRLRNPNTSARGEPIPAHAFIAAAGGLNRAAASDMGVDGNPRIGNRTLFAGQGRGLSMDQATQMLIQDGYLSEGATINDALALIKTSLTRPQYNADGIERIAQAESDAQFEDYMAAQEEMAQEDDGFDPFGLPPELTAEDLDAEGYTTADPALQAEVNALVAQAEAAGIDTYDVLEDIARTYANATQDQYNAAAREALAAAIARSNQDGGGPAPAAAPAAPRSEPEQGLNRPVALDQQAQAATETVAPTNAQEGIAAAQAKAARFAIGKSLTKEQRKQVLESLVDTYKTKGAEREFKGLDSNGNDRYGYVYSPELFEKSDITGAMVRYYVTLPDGRIAHPTELFQDVSASDVERMALEQESKKKAQEAYENAIKPFYPDFDSANLMATTGQVVISKGDRLAIIPDRTGAVGQARQQGWEVAKQAQTAIENVVPESLELASQTPAEAAAQQEAQEQAAKAEAARQRAADAQAARDEERKRIAQASVRAADRFELGQDPLDSLTGQGNIFDAPEPEQQAAAIITAKETDKGVAMFSRTGAKSPNAQQPTTRAWYDRFVSLLPASYRNDPHRREPFPAEDWNVQRATEVRGKVESLNKQLRGENDRKGYGPISIDGLGNLQVSALDVSVDDLDGPIKALANELGAGIAVTKVRAAGIQALQRKGFVAEISLAPVADRIMGREFVTPANAYATDAGAQGAIMTYKPRGFPAVLFARDTAIPPADSNARNAATQLLVDGLKAKWTRAPEIIVARNMQDAQIPQAVRDYDETLKSQGATGEARGFIYKGKVYLLSDQLKGPQQIAEVLFHEVLGHYGLHGAFGESLTPILQQMGTMRRKEVVAKAREYGLFDKDALGGLDKKAASDAQIWAAMSAKDRLSAAEEVLAEMAQTQPTIGFVQRAIAAIRNWLRANVPGFERMRLTDNDIIQAYILPARGFVTRSKETGAQSLRRAMAAFSRDTNGAVTNQNDVVGNQGGRSADDTTPGDLLRKLEGTQVVDPNGAPLLVYHGSKSQIDRFDASKTIDGGLHFGSKSQASMRSSKILHPAYLYAKNLRRSKDTGSNWKAKIASAKAAGYDGIVYLNRYEGVSKETVFRLHSQGLSEKLDRMSDAEFRRAVPEAEDSYIVFDAKQVIQQNESSAPDSGGAAFSRTPGDQTQTEASNPDIRFSFAGQQAATADTMALATAQQRLEAGEDAETVRQETGWHKGVDGKWRFEISDADARLKDRTQWTAKIDGINAKRDAALQALWQAKEQRNDFLRARGESPSRISSETKKTPEFKALAKALKNAEAAAEKAQDAAFLARQGDSLITVGDVLSHPALFAAYPGIADVRVDINDSLPAGNAAYAYELRAIELSGKSDAQQLLSTLLHEIQHGIQHIEGFATGGNQDSRADVMQAVSQQRTLWADVYAVRRELDAGKKLDAVLEEWQEFLDAQPSAEALRIAQDPELETSVALQNMETLERQYAQLRNEGRGDTYRRLAGEVEARNTQARQGMTDEQRRATPPSQTADVADSRVIVMFNGKEMANAPMPANAAPDAATTAQPLRTPAATIRAAITKAYGKLLGQLESKGLVTLTQTEDEAIEAAAQARAAKTGQSVEQARSTLRASVKNSVADQTQTENFQRWFAGSRAVDANGKPLVVYHGTNADFSEFNTTGGSDKFANNKLGAFFAADPDMAQYGRAQMPVYLSIKNPYVAKLSEWAHWQNTASAAEVEAKRAQLIDGGHDGVTDGMGVYVAFNPTQIKSAIGNNGAFDPANPDIRRSADGSIQGFFDPQTGQSFLIADNLTAEAAPGVLMHEVGIHMAADGSMKALFNRAAMMLKLQRGNPFMKAVQDRMDAAGETSGEEAAAYIAEAYENDRANAPASVQRWLADLLAAVKAWMFKKGIMGADRLTVADIAAVARANARSMARDGGATGGQGFGTAFSRAPAGDQTQTEAFKRWFKDSKAVDANGRPLVVYHGTHSSFTEFKPNDALGGGMFFSPSPEEAGAFTGATGSNIMPVYLSAQKVWPKIVRSYDEVKAIRAAKSKGYDAIRVRDDQNGVVNWVVFDPTQVKSATGNNGNFDPANPDIRFSRAPVAPAPAAAAATGWDAPVQTGFDDVIYKLQDKNIDLKRVVEAITKSVGQVSDSINAYLKEELFHKRAAKRVADFGAHELKPLMNQMRLAGLSMEDVEEYLHARHAKEANAVIAQRNPGEPGLQDGGSGMTNQAADNYFAKLDPAQRRKLEAVAKNVDAIIDKTRKLYVSYGLENQDVVDGWASMYQHYIPLMREDKDGGMGTGQGFSVKGKETKGRTGSTRKVVDILANVAMQREKLIVRGEKNIVAQALVGLAQANPNPDFWEVRSQAPTERVFDPKTGVVVDRPDPLFKSRENVAVAKVKDANGNVTEQMVVFNEDNPRAVRMAAAMKNLDAGNLEGLLGMSAKITRYFSAINTQYNPVFGVVNLVRDVQGAMVNLAATPLAGQQGKIAKDTVSALRGIYSDIRKTRRGGQATSQWAALWEQMQDDGGTTGYRELFTTSADRANNLKSILNPEAWMDNKWGKFFTANGQLKVPMSIAQKGATEIFGWLSDYNEAMENGVRLAAYKAALDKGMSREQAASLAKNLTVNFNRKGQVGMQAGAVYAFFNAAMQGTARIGQTLFDMDGGDISTLRLSKTGKAVVYGGVTLGVMQALALAGAGFDEEDPPEFVRERSLIIPTGGKTYVSIPMPLGLHVIPGIGRHATEFALSGFDKPAKRAVSMVGMFADAFNPIGNAGLSMQTIAPTALDPLVALSENKDWTGKPIARVSSNKAMPGHTQWKDTATGFSKVVAEAINWISGGNEYVAGAFSPTPDQIDYLLAQVGGGVAREAAKVQQTISTAMSGETLPTHKIPLVGRFVGNAASQASQGGAFYANLNKLNELETEIKGLRKDGRFDEAAKLVRENPQATMIAMANRAERDVQKLRRDKRELIAKDASREEVRAKEEQITAVMMRLNEAAERRKAN